MRPPGQIKEDIRNRYDDLGAGVLREIARVDDLSRLWNQVEGYKPALAYFRRRKIEAALRLGRFPGSATIVEVGCGTGDYALLLSRMGYRVVGVDISPKSIDAARTKAAKLGFRDSTFLVSDAETLEEIPAGWADGVVSFSTLRYVPRLHFALRAIWRVLKPGGTTVLDFPNRYCPWFRWLKNRVGVETHIHDHQYSAAEIVTEMTQAGFQAIDTRHILFTPYVLPSCLLPVFRCIDRVGERMPALNRTAGIVMARGVKP